MKQIIVILMCLFGAMAVAPAQGLKVSVHNDLKEPLPHAYVYVNGRAVAVADTLGMAVIPQDKLKLGDTISISYVATEGQTVVFDQNLSTTGEYQFILKEIYASLRADAVTVKPDMRKLYRKHVKRRGGYSYYSIWNGDFSMRVRKKGDSVRTITGRLKTAFAPPYSIARSMDADSTVLDSIKKIWMYSHCFLNQLPVKISTLDDTIGLSRILKHVLPLAFQINNVVLWTIRSPDPGKWDLAKYPEAKVSYGYLGKDEHHRIFRLTYSGYGDGFTWQILLKCDIKSGSVREITHNAMNKNTGFVARLTTKIGEERLNTPEIMPPLRYVPIELEYQNEYNGRVIDVTMKSINIQDFGKPKEGLVQAIRRMMRTGKL